MLPTGNHANRHGNRGWGVAGASGEGGWGGRSWVGVGWEGLASCLFKKILFACYFIIFLSCALRLDLCCHVALLKKNNEEIYLKKDLKELTIIYIRIYMCIIDAIFVYMHYVCICVHSTLVCALHALCSPVCSCILIDIFMNFKCKEFWLHCRYV